MHLPKTVISSGGGFVVSKTSSNKQKISKNSPSWCRHLSYKEYLKSFHWQEIREKALKQAENQCELCGGNIRLNVHHLSYKNLGIAKKEKKDIIVLCSMCHALQHFSLDKSMADTYNTELKNKVKEIRLRNQQKALQKVLKQKHKEKKTRKIQNKINREKKMVEVINEANAQKAKERQIQTRIQAYGQAQFQIKCFNHLFNKPKESPPDYAALLAIGLKPS